MLEDNNCKEKQGQKEKDREVEYLGDQLLRGVRQGFVCKHEEDLS